MFARGLVSGHPTKDVHPELVEGFFSYFPPPLLGRKPSSVKSCVSITSKLIQIKRLQLQYFGHLRKTGGRGVLLACPERSAFFAPRVLHRVRRACPESSRRV